jgi:hypothetical protein
MSEMAEFKELKETWSPVITEGFENLYEVSSFGSVRKTTTQRILKQETSAGYKRVCMSRPTDVNRVNAKKHELVHRLVALVFIPNTDSTKTIVNHKDGNKSNNKIDNLEWASYKENARHAFDTGLRKSKGKPIIIIDADGDVFEYANQQEAQKEAKLGENTILRALKNGNKPFGMTIKYKNEEDIKTTIDLTDFEEIVDFPGYFINRDTCEIYGKISERILKYRISPGGYPVVSLCKNKKITPKFVHNAVAKQFIPNPDNLPVVNHKDHNKLNYSIDNLEYVSFKENTRQYLVMKQNNSVLSHTEQSDDGSGENSEVEEKSEL